MAKKKTRKSTSKRRPTASKQKEHPTNFNDVLIRLIDAFYDLGQSGNLALMMIFTFVASLLILFIKLPPGDISGFFKDIGKFLSEEKFYLFPLGGAFCVSIYALFKQRQLYTKEINRLTRMRKKIIHGVEAGDLNALEHHNSSGFDVEDEPINGDSIESRKSDD